MLKKKVLVKGGLKTKVKGINKPVEGRVKKALASANASLAVEGLKPSKLTVSLGKQYLEGKISAQDAIAKVKAKYLMDAGIRND